MNVALGVTGCIAAFKAIEVMRGLQRAGVSVQVILTRSATHFVTPLTFEALSGRPVITEMFRPEGNTRIEHIRVAQEIRLLAVVPATANIMGKFARGIADDFLSTLYLSCPAPVLLAPAMNVEMWKHPAVRANVAILRGRGHAFIDPEPGELACGMEGEGKLAEVRTIVEGILDQLARQNAMAGLKVLVTAGPTVEDIDPIRFLSNRSSGKMGYAVATAARTRGASVYLVSGPTVLETPGGIQHIPVRSAEEMKRAVLDLYPEMDIVVKAAAVADYRPAEPATGKLKKTGDPIAIRLVPTDDILALLGAKKQHQVLVGFAAETGAVEQEAVRKLHSKNLDLIVANDVTQGIFGADSATVHILAPSGESTTLENQTKLSIANRILELAQKVLTSRASSRPA